MLTLALLSLFGFLSILISDTYEEIRNCSVSQNKRPQAAQQAAASVAQKAAAAASRASASRAPLPAATSSTAPPTAQPPLAAPPQHPAEPRLVRADSRANKWRTRLHSLRLSKSRHGHGHGAALLQAVTVTEPEPEQPVLPVGDEDPDKEAVADVIASAAGIYRRQSRRRAHRESIHAPRAAPVAGGIGSTLAKTTTSATDDSGPVDVPEDADVMQRKLSVSVRRGELSQKRAVQAVRWVDKEVRIVPGRLPGNCLVWRREDVWKD